MKNKILFLFLIQFFQIYTRIIETTDLNWALSEASPGDIIELKSSEYSSVPYKITKSGTNGNPITIKSSEGANIIFKGTNENCIFDFSEISYISIEGQFELKDALCGIKAMDVLNIKISGLKIYNIIQQGIVISGENNEISNNEIFDCVLENKEISKKLTYGWKQCIAIWGKKFNSYYSKNIIFNNNYIHDTWGEGLYFQKCDGCSSIGNNITNGFSMNIYLESSKNILIDSNILRVNSDEHNSHIGKACGIGLSSERGNENKIENIFIQNNIIVGTRIAIYFFQIGFSAYTKIKILHNTLWLIGVTSLWFEKPNNSPIDCELRNNLIYIDNWIAEFYPKSAWTIENNYYYNISKVPLEYCDTNKESKATKNIDLNYIFNNRRNNCNYYDENIDINCFRPSLIPSNDFQLFHNGSKPTTIEVNKDFSGCQRNEINPSIGAFEYSIGCSGEPFDFDFKVKFKINYYTSGTDVVKIIGNFCSWYIGDAPTFTQEENGNWVYTFDNIYDYFEYKFLIANGYIGIRWEEGSNRKFNLEDLTLAVKLSQSGYYENCDYIKDGNLVTLTCRWNVKSA